MREKNRRVVETGEHIRSARETLGVRATSTLVRQRRRQILNARRVRQHDYWIFVRCCFEYNSINFCT